MQFTRALLAAAALSLANAVQFTMGPAAFVGITAGSTFDLTWSNATGPVTITLTDGSANNLQTVSIIASGLTGTSYAWSIPSTQPDDSYALEISDSTSTPNYSVPFALTGGSASSSRASGSTTPTPTGSSTASGKTTASTPTASTTGNSSSSTSAATTASRNSTTTSSSSKSATKITTTSSSTGTSSATTAPKIGSAANLASPLAFVLMAFAAIMTLN